MNKKSIWILIIVVVVLILAIVSFGEKNKQSSVTEKTKVGVLLPLTGSFPWWGETTRNGIQLAESKGLTNNLEFVYQDTQCNTKDAVSGTQSLKALNPTMHVFIVGCDNDLRAMLPILDRQKDLAFVAGLSGADLYESKFPIINLSYRLEDEASSVANFVSKKLGVKKLGLILGNNTFGNVLNDSIPKDFAALGGKTVVEQIKINDSNPETAVLKVVQSKPDAIYIHNDIPTIVAILKRLDQVGYKGQRIATYAAKDQSTIDGAGKAAEGLYLPWAISSKTSLVQQNFEISYKSKFNKDPFVTAYFVYDGVNLLNEADIKCNGDVRCIEKYFYSKSDFESVLGNLKFQPGGEVERNFYFQQVKNGIFVEVK